MQTLVQGPPTVFILKVEVEGTEPNAIYDIFMASDPALPGPVGQLATNADGDGTVFIPLPPGKYVSGALLVRDFKARFFTGFTVPVPGP